MIQFPMRKKLAVLIILAIAILFGGYELGVLEPLYTQDKTYITWLISALWLVSVGLMAIPDWKLIKFISGLLPSLGLLGTLVGLKIALGGAVGEDYNLRDLGVYSAVNTTILGIVGNMTLDTMVRVLRHEKE